MRTWIFGDNINTDLITPGRYNITTDPSALAKVAFIEHRPEFAKKVTKGDLVIGGNNFGCGSSRETAVTALKYSGIKAIIAPSFARIFYRNCLNQGVYAVIADTHGIEEGDEISINFTKKVVVNKTKGTKVSAIIPNVMVTLHTADGIIPYIKAHGLDGYKQLFTETV